MSDILVIDDSLLERTVVVAVLKKRVSNVNVVAVGCAAEALELLDSTRFDLVLTDMMMPGIDGFRLIQEVQSRGLDVPVVLMTSFTDAETAMKALRAGAASYVPKREIQHLLPSTIEAVLSLSQSRHTKARLLTYMTETQFRFTIANDDSLVEPLVAHVQDQIRTMRLLPERDVVRLAVALHECLTNAILHGNLEVSSELRQNDEAQFYRLANERRQQLPYCLRDVFVNVTLSATEVRLSVCDQGPGFDVRKTLDPDRTIDLDRIGGRGLLLVKSFSDVVYHNAAGNEITMIKFVKPITHETATDAIETAIAAAASAIDEPDELQFKRENAFVSKTLVAAR